MAYLLSTLALAALALAAPSTKSKRLENSLGVQLGINPDSMISYESVYFGFAPDYSQPITMAFLNSATGQKAATYNVYSQLKSENVASGSYDGNDQFPVDDIISSGAVLIMSLMPTIDWTDISTGLASSVASYIENTFTSQGVTVWLRFAHEMNWYIVPTSGTGGPVYPGGTNYGAFMTGWQNMYNAISGNDKIFMFWCPNDDTPDEPAAPWWPGKQYVDIVGMDVYPRADKGIGSFDSVYGTFYNTYAAGNGLPFAIAETGTMNSDNSDATMAQKQEWLKNIINPSSGLSAYSQYYVSATWFEYGPTLDPNFYIVWGETEYVNQTISNTENGSA